MASMGPQLISCGTLVKLTHLSHLFLASMGPQLISCGTVSVAPLLRMTDVGFNGAAADQLRNDPDVRVKEAGQKLLQWGRS